MQKEKIRTANLMKIGELAGAADVNLSTLKFYVKEGLIRPVCKTGKNMSWYDPSCVDVIRTIRILQKERFYPLSVIKRLLQSPAADSPPELALLDAIHKVDYRSAGKDCSLAEAVKRTHLSGDQVRRLAAAGLVGSGGKKPVFSTYDLSVMELVYKRTEAGIPFSQTLGSFAVYARALDQAVQADVDSFVRSAMLEPQLTETAGAWRIRVSDETLDSYIGLTRQKYNRIRGSEYLEKLYGFFDRLELALRQLPETLARSGYQGEAGQCAAAAAGETTGDEILDCCTRRYRQDACRESGSVSDSLKYLISCREYFASLDGGNMAVRSMRFLWLRLAPEILNCKEAAQRAAAHLGDPALCEQLEKLPQRL